MEPYLRDGEHVLTFNWGKVKVGDVIVYWHYLGRSGAKTRLTGRSDRISLLSEILLWSLPLQDDRKVYYIKRVTRVSAGRFFVEGDNKKYSSKVSPIEKSQIVGRVILRY